MSSPEEGVTVVAIFVLPVYFYCFMFWVILTSFLNTGAQRSVMDAYAHIDQFLAVKKNFELKIHFTLALLSDMAKIVNSYANADLFLLLNRISK